MAKVDLAGKLDDARARVEAETPAEDRGLAKFARLTRKDARVRADQDAALAALAKTLMRRRPVKAELITENTLIRVAIDLLLAHADELRGSTENELRESVTSEPSNSRTSGLTNARTSVVAESRTPGVADTRTLAVADSRTDGPTRVRLFGCRCAVRFVYSTRRRGGVAMITVTVYSTGPQCMRCGLTRRRLDEAGIPFTVVDLTRQENASQREFVTDELGYAEAPVVVVDDEPEHHWCGFRPDLIDRLAASIGARS